MRLCNRCGSPDLNTGFVCSACGLAPYDAAIFDRPQPTTSTASTTTIHTLAHSKGVPTAAREAMLLMQERIAELEWELAQHEKVMSDPSCVHINMLRGIIALPTVQNILHLYGEEKLRQALSGKEQTDGE